MSNLNVSAIIKNLCNADGFITLPKVLCKTIGFDETVLLMELIAEYNYWDMNDKLENGYFYSTQQNIEENTGFNSYSQRTISKKLCDLNLLKIEKRGMPAKNYFYINFDVLGNIIQSPQLFKDLSTSDTKNVRQVIPDFVPQDVKNLKINNNKKINNEKIIKSEDFINSKNSKAKPKSKKDKYLEKINDKLLEYDFIDEIQDLILTFFEDKAELSQYCGSNQLDSQLSRIAGVSISEQRTCITKAIDGGWKNIDAYLNNDFSNKQSVPSYHIYEDGDGNHFSAPTQETKNEMKEKMKTGIAF